MSRLSKPWLSSLTRVLFHPFQCARFRVDALGYRCPHCLLHGTSAQEIQLAAELTALGLPVSARHKLIKVTGRRPVRGDVVLANWHVVIKLVGEFWHTDNVSRDQVQTKALLDGVCMYCGYAKGICLS